ncbi:MAG: ABC transporter permease [Candidatus Omnitrophota bacterium]
MQYENWISFRYLSAKKAGFLSAINLISIIGIAIGVMALIVVIGVMTGFDTDLRNKIIGTNAHIVIEKESGIRSFEAVREKIKDVPGITATTAYIHGSIFLESDGRAMGLGIRGVNPASEKNVTKISQYLVKGKIEDLTGDGVIVGSELADYFGFTLGDTITLIAPASGISGQSWRYKLSIVGIFTSGMYDYDMNLILVNLKKAQEIFNLPADTATGIAVNVSNVYRVGEAKESIHEILGYGFLVRTWVEANRNFFAALRLEKLAMFIILALIVLVASFNIFSTLMVTVKSKVKDIGILKSIGVPKNAIRRIFTLTGISIGIIGTFWGTVCGVTACIVLKKYQFIKLPQEIYYIDRLPVILQLSDILIIITSAILISYLATVYPAHQAANLEPVEALRYE